MLTMAAQKADSPRRWASESLLLGVSAAFLVVNFLALDLLRPGLNRLSHWLPLVLWGTCAVVGKRLLDRKLPGHDPVIFPLAMFLSGWGLVLIERLAPNFADRQILWLVLSVGAMLLAAALPHLLRWLRNYRYSLLVAGLGLLAGTIVLGTNPSGQAGAPELWLGFGPIFVQPSEILKIILAAFLASYLAEQYPAMRAAGLASEGRRLGLSPRVVGPVLLMWGLSVVILVWQRDLGTAALFFVVFLVLLYIASGHSLILVSGGLLLLIAGIIAYREFSVVRLRVDIWLNPWPEADARAFQIVQSLLAFAAGGIFGQGVGQGSPVYIPVVHSDFVFAALAEEWGLLGIVAALVCILALFTRGLRIGIQQQGRPFQALLAVGLSTLLAAQSLLITGGVLKVLPLTGVTLPFMSYGGSSLLASFIIVGLLLRLSTPEANHAVHP
ncbi:MAG: FtsW/RodA/SpoVE family cell cycle protein [Chloroflexi bacterium]|nr:FtsW/RodA/SpoVE family cell cycle protein [Chloroflexota bacterium]